MPKTIFISQFLIPTTVCQNFYAAKFCCGKVTWSKLTIEFTEDKTEKPIQNKFYLKICSRKSKPAGDSRSKDSDPEFVRKEFKRRSKTTRAKSMSKN